jgi:hypothetical protein
MTTRATNGVGKGRRVIATYDQYGDAERAVDYLSDHGFPVERTAIAGDDLQFIEQVTGRLDYGRAALRGAIAGAVVGALIGWLFGIFDWVDPILTGLWLALNGLWIGAIVGALAGVLTHALSGGRRDFASVPTVRAQHYSVLADEEVADEAARLLAQANVTPAPAREEAQPAT